MTRRLVLVLALLVPSLAHAAKVRIVSTTQDPAAIARAVGGDRVQVSALAAGYQDPHFLEAKPSYMLLLNKADLLLAVGLDLEAGYLPSLVQGARNPKVQPGKPGYLDLSTVIDPLEVIGVADRGQGDIHPNGNPHYWLDPENGRKMARGIAARLTDLDPEGKDAYAANLAAFEKALDAKLADWTKRMEPLRGKPVVTFHRSWSYFAARFGLEVIGFVEPKPGIPPAPQHTLALIKSVRAKGAKLLLMESFYDKKVPELIAEKSGAKVVSVPNSVGGEPEVKTYFDLFERIVSGIEAAGK